MSDRPDMPTGQQDDEFVDEEGGSQPIFNLPTAMVLTVALLVAIYVVDAYLLSDAAREWLLVEFAFTPLRYVYPLAEQGFEWLWTPVTYSLLHGSVAHIGFNIAWLLIFGAPVLRRIGTARYLVFWVLSAAASAFFHAAINWGEPTVLIGASGVISALMGGALRFAFPPGNMYEGGFGGAFGHIYPRQTIFGALRSRTVVVFLTLWFISNLALGLGWMLVDEGGDAIAWDAHIGGFLFGYLLFGLFDRVR